MTGGSGPIVAIDQGKSGTRAVAHDPADGRVLTEVVSVGFDYGSRRDVDDELVASLLRAVAALGLRIPPAVIGIATTGAPESKEAATTCARAIALQTGAGRVLLTEDVVAAHLGALAGASGVVVSAGTGSIALWTDGVSSRRVDGWGPLLGDYGSGYDIGSRGLRAAFAAVDGRGPATLLTHGAHDYLGGLGLDSARRMHARFDSIAFLGDFAPAVSTAAEAGDVVAERILDDAGCALAKTACAAVNPAATDRGSVCASYTGRVFQSRRVLESFRKQSQQSGLEVVSPSGGNLDGALKLAREPSSQTFATLIADTDQALST